VGALLVADLERVADGAAEAAGAAQVDDAGGSVEHDPLDQRLVQQGRDRAGADDGPAGELADATLEGLVTHEHADQWPGTLAVGGCGHRPRGELDECVVPPLGRGAAQMAGGGGVAVFGTGGGPVGLEQLLLDPPQRGVDGGVGQRRQHPVQDPGAPHPRRQVHPAQGLVMLGVALDTIGVGVLTPVLDGPDEVCPRQGAGVVDEDGLVAHEVLGGAAARQRGQHHGVTQRDVAGGEGLGRGGHGAQPAAQPRLGPGLADREAAAVGQPRSTGPGPVVGPHPTGVGRRGQSGHGGGQPGLLAMQPDHRCGQLGVIQRVRVDLEQLVDRRGQRSSRLARLCRRH
jgi:hypothetical protein